MNRAACTTQNCRGKNEGPGKASHMPHFKLVLATTQHKRTGETSGSTVTAESCCEKAGGFSAFVLTAECLRIHFCMLPYALKEIWSSRSYYDVDRVGKVEAQDLARSKMERQTGLERKSPDCREHGQQTRICPMDIAISRNHAFGPGRYNRLPAVQRENCSRHGDN